MNTNPITAMYQQAAAKTAQVFTDFVTGEEQVKSYPVPVGTTIILIDLQGGKMWFKSRDASGVPGTLRLFDIKEKVVTQPPPGSISREEFNGLSQKFNELSGEVKDLTTNLGQLIKALTPEGGEKK